MTLWSRFRSWVLAILRRSRIESEMDAELRFHIAAFAEDLLRSGVPRQEALRPARIEFGGIERAKEECRQAPLSIPATFCSKSEWLGIEKIAPRYDRSAEDQHGRSTV